MVLCHVLFLRSWLLSQSWNGRGWVRMRNLEIQFGRLVGSDRPGALGQYLHLSFFLSFSLLLSAHPCFSLSLSFFSLFPLSLTLSQLFLFSTYILKKEDRKFCREGCILCETQQQGGRRASLFGEIILYQTPFSNT